MTPLQEQFSRIETCFTQFLLKKHNIIPQQETKDICLDLTMDKMRDERLSGYTDADFIHQRKFLD